ncbi:MAG: hypothetical protein CL920_22305 [Deltaproteobacteria bacterium]|nr:hypothetical protein [Deltaproteobacteria bacterium]|tara:strand:- start:2622 stop:3728 length:1107 start_codon:yes stop_codon:yes gene_type:complete
MSEHLQQLVEEVLEIRGLKILDDAGFERIRIKFVRWFNKNNEFLKASKVYEEVHRKVLLLEKKGVLTRRIQEFHSLLDECVEILNSFASTINLNGSNSIAVGSARVMSQNCKMLKVAIVAALEDELQHLSKLSMFDWKDDYLNCGLPVKIGGFEDVQICAAYASDMGLTDASILSTRMVLSYHPDLIAMIGICGGRKERGVNIGDVIFASHTFHYQFGSFEDGKLKQEMRQCELHDSIERELKAYIRNSAVQKIRESEGLYFYGHSIPGHRLKCHLGPIASSDYVVKDTSKLEDAIAQDRKVLAIDMESYAVMRTAKLFNINGLVVKSVSDFSDAKKGEDDNFREYAMYTSTMALIQYLLSKVQSRSS